MKLSKLKNILKDSPEKQIVFFVENHNVPSHFHLTEVGRVQKNFIDCGGIRRDSLICSLQLWVANDTDHRLNSTKMLKILDLSNCLFLNEDPEIQIEYEKDFISQFDLIDFKEKDSRIEFFAISKHTNCLAPEKCGVSCCSPNLVQIKL